MFETGAFTSCILKQGDHGRCTTGRFPDQFTDRPYDSFVFLRVLRGLHLT